MLDAKRTVYLHIGLHKTGSTTIQHFLHVQEGELRRSGFLIPVAGRQPGSGAIHSNFSWQYLGSRSFRAEYGTLEDAMAEIAKEAEFAKILISDEGLSRVTSPEDFLKLFAGFQIVIVVFKRNPFKAAPSLYTEYLKFGTPLTFSEWLRGKGREMLDHNALIDRWRIPSVYLDISDVDDIREENTGLIEKYCNSIGYYASNQLQEPEAQNTRMSAQECIALFYANNIVKQCNFDANPKDRNKFNRKIRKCIKDEFGDDLFPYYLSAHEIDEVRRIFPHHPLREDVNIAQKPINKDEISSIKRIVIDVMTDIIFDSASRRIEKFEPNYTEIGR